MDNIFLIEDHHQALGIWRQKNIKGLDLVHLDAHIDFEFHQSKPVQKIVGQAKSLEELKRSLENSIAFMRYEKDFDKQINSGNYVYQAMEQGIVNNFYWVIPGGKEEFKKSSGAIKNILENILINFYQKISIKENKSEMIRKQQASIKLLRKKIIICTLKSLPSFEYNVLLDIDTDFLVINNLQNSDKKAKIGKRKPWILPKDLVSALKNKIKRPKTITISYSVNGGWTPIKYKHLADEMAYYFSPQIFKNRYERNLKAAKYFNLFISTGRKEYYQKSVKLNRTYRAADNNYGPLYFSLRKFLLAKKEFSKILKADPKNIACLLGLGCIALEKRNFKEAKKYFAYTLKSKDNKLFADKIKQGLLGLAKTEYSLKNFDKAKRLLLRFQKADPMNAQSHYLLGRIYEREKKYEHSVRLYKDAFILGFDNQSELIRRLLGISKRIKEKESLIKYILIKYKGLKKIFLKIKPRQKKDIRDLARLKKKTKTIDKILERMAQKLK